MNVKQFSAIGELDALWSVNDSSMEGSYSFVFFIFQLDSQQSVYVFTRDRLNWIMFWNIGLRETQPCFFFSSSDRQSVIVVWDESRVCVASCDREIERNSELSASLPVKRRYVLNKHIFLLCVHEELGHLK